MIPWVNWIVVLAWASLSDLFWTFSCICGKLVCLTVTAWSCMASPNLMAGWLAGGQDPSFLPSFSRLAQVVHSVACLRFQAQKESEPQCTSAFQAFVCIVFANVPLTKVSHMTNPFFKGWGYRPTLLKERSETSHKKSMEAERQGICSHFNNLSYRE